MRSRHLAFVLASAVAAASIAGCGSNTLNSPDDPPTLAEGFTAAGNIDPTVLFGQISTDPRFDGVVLREVGESQALPASDAGPQPACSSTFPAREILRDLVLGDPCGRAPDAKKCKDALACLAPRAGWMRETGRSTPKYLLFVFGAGGELTPVTTQPDLVARLLPIDSPQKALLLLTLEMGVRVSILGYRAAQDGYEMQVRGGGECTNERGYEALVLVSKNGAVTQLERIDSETSIPACSEGRRPTGLVSAPRGGIGRGVGQYLAEAAHLEAAAVVAFAQMADALRSYGAPAHLVDAADRARRDEIRHARTMTALARSFGEEPEAVRCDGSTAASLEALAIENVVEGCVRETYAVLRAMWQAQHAGDRRLRSALAVIARDESRHAELSWDLAAWLDSKLDAPARARVETARLRALADLRRELEGEPHPEVVHLAGMPSSASALRLLDELTDRLPLAA